MYRKLTVVHHAHHNLMGVPPPPISGGANRGGNGEGELPFISFVVSLQLLAIIKVVLQSSSCKLLYFPFDKGCCLQLQLGGPFKVFQVIFFWSCQVSAREDSFKVR